MIATPTGRRRRPALVVATALVLVAGPASAALRVVVGIPPLAWVTEQVGGDRVEVEVLLPPGASPETWQPSDAAVGRLLAADAYLRMGVDLERGRWMEALRAHRGLRLVDLAGALGLDAPGSDPHAWTSPATLRRIAREIHDGLAPLDPGGREAWASGLAALDLRLGALQDEISGRLAAHRGRSFLVYHPAWDFLARDFGLIQEAVEEEGSPPSDRRLTELRRLVAAEGHRVLFSDPRTGGPAARRAATALGLEVRELDPLPRDLEAGLRAAAAALDAAFAATAPRDAAP